ncbi:MAG: DUF1636 domain-containing protein [Polyangiales bacterium]
MKRPVEVIACFTCGGAERDEQGRPLGAQLLAKLEAAASEAGTDSNVAVSGMRCLWACKMRCAVHVRAPGKTAYVLAHFEPSDDAARGIIDYARAYGQSADGAVPFREWPQAVKGHFLCRIPTPPSEDDVP